MEDTILKCAICCEKTFRSKPALIEHLAEVLGNIICPICSNKWSSLAHLIEHLSLDNCQAESAAHATDSKACDAVTSALTCEVSPNVSENSSSQLEQLTSPKFLQNETNGSTESADPFQAVDKEGPDGRMYVELLSKQKAKPCLQTQELKLVREDGVSRYVIVSDENCDTSAGSTIVTKQNYDGTISLTTVKEMKLESDTVITQESEAEDNQEEVYSCNTCGVSFTSVLDHIQNYHNDQDVVVEEPMDESSSDVLPVEFEDPLAAEETSESDKQTSRRMITESGNIVETPMKTDSIELEPFDTENKSSPPQIKEEAVEKAVRTHGAHAKRYVQIDKFCDSVVKDIKKPDAGSGPYHKVVLKEMQTTHGQRVRVYHCVTCNIYVSSLDEFKAHPCKTLKYVCPHCPVSYENAKSLCAHMKVHKGKAGQTEVSYECAVCATAFPTNKSLKLHKRMHEPIKARAIEAPVERADGLAGSADRFLCGVCDKLIPIDYQLIHQNSHRNTDKFNCDICNKKFNSSDYLDMHMSVHSADKAPPSKQDQSLPYTCLYCERRFTRPHEKVKHERIHTGEKPHSCEICGKSFRVSYCLTLHMRTHTGARPYACTHCGKRFKAHSVYNHHLLTHSEVRAYKCPYCPKAFKTSVQLAGHRNSHTKPFSCQHCNRPFASLYAVRVHTETHARQNNLKFSCALCGACYARAFALKDHVKQVHDQDLDAADGSLSASKKGNWIAKRSLARVDEESAGKDLPQEMNRIEIISNNESIVP